MSDLNFKEKAKLERLFRMDSGYVLGFSNASFANFVTESAGRDIDDPRFSRGGGSKANRLRRLWADEANHIVGKLTADMIEHREGLSYSEDESGLIDDCKRIADRLLQGASIDAIESISNDGDAVGFDVLAKAVKDSINNNEPETGLDRLHTFVVKMVRHRLEKRGHQVSRDKPLHSLFGEYVKALRSEGLIESDMGERILKSTISVLEAFCHVRNNQTLAHDNPTLGYNESLLVFNHVCGLVRFLKAVDAPKMKVEPAASGRTEPDGEIPF